jgi:signal transduction histidine kinase
MADPPNLDRARRNVERILRDANAAADVVSHIRALFKQTAPAQTNTSLAVVIAEAKRLLVDTALMHGVGIETEVGADVPTVAVDQLQIQQVLVNLMRNGIEAMDAMDAMGTRRSGKALRVHAQRDGDFARVEVHDEGSGVTDPDRVFDAFFTTKKSGMGMGLAISRSIVASHGGRLWVEGHAGRGTCFVFTVPLAAKASS